METELTSASVTPALTLLAGQRATWAVTTDGGFTGEARLQSRFDGGWLDVRNVTPGEAGTVDGPGQHRLSVLSIGAEQDITFAITVDAPTGAVPFTVDDKAKLDSFAVAEAVAEATDETDIVDQFNALLASLQAAGLMAPTPED